jgi:hypothetical protein
VTISKIKDKWECILEEKKRLEAVTVKNNRKNIF